MHYDSFFANTMPRPSSYVPLAYEEMDNNNEEVMDQPEGNEEIPTGKVVHKEEAEYVEFKATVHAVAKVKQEAGMYVSSSRTWILNYSILTWLMTVAFFVVLLIAYGTQIDSSSMNTLPKRGIVTSIGCLERKSFLQWNDVFKRYQTLHQESVWNQTKLIHDVLEDMHCALSNAITEHQWQYASQQCVCVKHAHDSIFVPRLAAIVADNTLTNNAKKELVATLGDNFAVKGISEPNGNKIPSIMQQCFFSYRPSQWIEEDRRCWSQVSPYSIVMYLNTIAGCFAGKFCKLSFAS